MNPHQGLRERKKRQFRDFALDAFADHEVLELLLFYAIPRRDTNPLAHELLHRFGSLVAVLEASVEELTAVPGMGRTPPFCCAWRPRSSGAPPRRSGAAP